MLNPKKIEIPSRDTYKLDNMRRVAEDLGHPELGRRTILVAGTNGKGSTCAFLTALFSKSGLKVGTYSSPHVVDRTERVRINGRPISESILVKYEEKFAEHLEPLTYFEQITILAFLIFRDLKVDLQILEVGMGGRLDATNISQPDFSAITRIDYDHCEILGETLTEIATEKAGIMRLNRPCIVGSQRSEARRALLNQGALHQSELLWADAKKSKPPFKDFYKWIEKEIGTHQPENAVIALRIFEEAQKVWPDLRKLSSSQLKNCFARGVLWPARLQILSERPLFLVDGAHNENSIDAFVDYFKRRYRNLKNLHCVFGAMKDKDVGSMLRRIGPLVSTFHLPSFYLERELSPHDLKQVIRSKYRNKEVLTHDSVADCLKLVKKLQRSKKVPVVVVGSLYLAGAVLGSLKKARR